MERDIKGMFRQRCASGVPPILLHYTVFGWRLNSKCFLSGVVLLGGQGIQTEEVLKIAVPETVGSLL